MRTPIRKPGKYSHANKDFCITKEKYDEMKNNLMRLKEKQPNLIREVKRLAEMGDFSENAAYQIAKGRLRGVNQKILEIENFLKQSVIIEPINNDYVQLGNTVTIEIIDGLGELKTKKYKILGSQEANPNLNIISSNSPLGSCLMGLKAGETKKAQIGEKNKIIKVLKIE